MENQRPESNRPPPPEPYPWLVYSYGKGNSNTDQIFCSITNPTKTYLRRIPELRNKKFLASCHGWCVYSNEQSDYLFLWNPVTLEKITLPPLKSNKPIDNCTLSSPPSAPGCMVILFVSERLELIALSLMLYCRLGDEEWIELSYGTGVNRFIEGTLLHNPVYCNGHLYAVTHREKDLVEIHYINEDSLKIKYLGTELPDGLPHSDFYEQYLMESCGELFAIEVRYGDSSRRDIVALGVHRFDFIQIVWEKVESAKDRTFFLSFDYNCLVSCPAINPEIEGGRVYFTLADDKSLYTYDMEDDTVSVSPPFPNLPTTPSFPIWVIPDLRLTNTLEKTIGDLKEQGGGKICEIENDVKGEGKTGDIKEAHSPDLPFDMAKLIAEPLILVDYLHFRATCKCFCSVAPPIQWRIASPRLENPSLSPWLVFFEKDSVITFIDPKHGDKYHIHTNLPPELTRGTIFDPKLTRGNIIFCSKEGWLLVSLGNLITFFFNPFTQGILRLPDCPLYYRNTTCIGFSSTPSSPDCVVVQIYTYFQTTTVAYYCSPGELEWSKSEFDNVADFLFNYNTPVFYKGAFYYLGQKGILGILKLNDEEHSWKVLTKPQSPCSGYRRQNFLAECEGELLSIFVGRHGNWVKVFKLNDSTMTWIKVKSLGNYMVYVSHLSSYSALAKIPGMENKIYFPRFFGQSIVFYSLETNKYHSFESTDVVVDFYSLREKLQCAWIEPRWSN